MVEYSSASLIVIDYVYSDRYVIKAAIRGMIWSDLISGHCVNCHGDQSDDDRFTKLIEDARGLVVCVLRDQSLITMMMLIMQSVIYYDVDLG